MDFARKYFVWILIGLVIVAEVGLMVFAGLKQGQADKRVAELDRLRRDRDRLRAQTRGAADVIKLYDQRRANATRELGEALLFLWHRGLAIESLFGDKRLQPYDVRPWKSPTRMDVFRAVYQTVYNDQVAALEGLLTRLGTSRAALRLADPSGFQQASVTIGDIFAMQKEFNVTKGLLEVFGQADAKVRNLAVGLSERHRAPEPHVHGRAPEVPGVLVDPVPVEFTVEVEYPRLDGMLEALLRSPICFRAKSITKMSPAASSQAAAAAPPPRRPGVPAAALAAAAASALEAEETTARSVSLTVAGEVEDLCVEVQKVTFQKAAFPDAAAVSKWLATEAAGLARRRAACQAATQALAGKPVRSQIAQWIQQELARVRAAAQPPAEGAGARKTEAKPLTVVDRLGDPPGREYVFNGPEEAEGWLARRCGVELELVAARAELVRRLTRALKTPAANPADRSGVVVTFRPLEHFDKKQLFSYALDAKGTVVAVLGLVTYKPEESVEGVKRAGLVR